jgi:hypothetical protein
VASLQAVCWPQVARQRLLEPEIKLKCQAALSVNAFKVQKNYDRLAGMLMQESVIASWQMWWFILN